MLLLHGSSHLRPRITARLPGETMRRIPARPTSRWEFLKLASTFSCSLPCMLCKHDGQRCSRTVCPEFAPQGWRTDGIRAAVWGGGRAGGHVLPQAGPQGPGGQQAAHLEDVVIVGEPAHVAEGRVAAAAAKQGQTTDARGHERLGGARQQL